MTELWSVTAVDGRITEAYLAPRPAGLAPTTYHIPVERRIFAFADGFDTAEDAVQALTTYLAEHIPVPVVATPREGTHAPQL